MSRSSLDPIVLSPRPAGSSRAIAGRAPSRAIATKKLALGILLATLFAVFLGRGSKAALEPLMAMHRSGNDIRVLESGLSRQQATFERLQLQKAYLNTPAGVEEEARRQGWVRRGETAIRVLRPAVTSADTTAKDQRPEADRSSGVIDRLRALIDTCLIPFNGRPANSTEKAKASPASTR